MSKINETLIYEFEKETKQSLSEISSETQEKERLLIQTIQRLEDSSYDKDKRIYEIKDKIKKLLHLKEEVSFLRGECE